jgi:hypothetical protein
MALYNLIYYTFIVQGESGVPSINNINWFDSGFTKLWGSKNLKYAQNYTQVESRINFNTYAQSSYGTEDSTGTVATENQGYTLYMQGNRWQKINYPYIVTPNTILEFDFQSTARGDIHAIGFDTDLVSSPDKAFKLYGTETWTGTNTAFSYASGVQHFAIPVGQYYTGNMNYMFFANDHDIASPTANSRFSICIKKEK